VIYDARPLPDRCAACESSTLRPHCPYPGCRWVTCLHCQSVTGHISRDRRWFRSFFVNPLR
jgi:hypothetical protein